MSNQINNSYFITSQDGVEVHIEEFGSGRPVLCLAGGPGFNAGYMYPVAEALCNENKVILLHQRGTGKSGVEKVDNKSMAMSNYGNDIDVLLQKLNLEKITIVGHSWGAMLAMEYASINPENVDKLILLGPGGPTPAFTKYVFDNIGKNLQQEDLDEMKKLTENNQPGFKANWNGYFYDRKQAMSHKEKINWKNFYGQPQVDAHTITEYFGTTENRVNGLGNFKGKSIIIQGEEDPMANETVNEIVTILPNTKVDYIAQCGHFPWLENKNQIDEFFGLLISALRV